MKVSHKGMQISATDWQAFVGHLLDTFKAPAQEREHVLAFIESTKADIVEA
jgi:hemoglobin